MKSLFGFRKRREHRLVALGDSLTLGFNNGCIYRTDLNYPSLLARAMGGGFEFAQPVFTAQGGLPLNLEVLIRGVSDAYGRELGWRNYISAFRQLYSDIRRIKRYWDGEYISLSRERNTPYHNQSVWGFTVADSWMMTGEICRKYIETHPPEFRLDSLLHGNAMYTTARCVLNPSFSPRFQKFSMLDNVRFLAENGGIENLIVFLGGNDALGAVTGMEIRYSTGNTTENLPFDRHYTITNPDHFRMLFHRLGEKLQGLNAKRVFIATVPYVTAPPASRGINTGERHEDGYFDYYTPFWVWESIFNPDLHPYLTRDQAMEIDHVVDAYNDTIREVAQKYGWIVVPLNEYVGQMAQRRKPPGYRITYPEAFLDALRRNPQTAYLVLGEDSSSLDSDYIRLEEQTGHLRTGGIFSLDGIHPTTIGYGLMADCFKKYMQMNGVHFEHDIAWDYIIENDTLVTNPPYLLPELQNLFQFLSMSPRRRWTAIGSNVLSQIMQMFLPGMKNGEAAQSQDSGK